VTLVWREHPHAAAELRAAADTYDHARTGTGTDFMDAVDHAIKLIQRWPRAAPAARPPDSAAARMRRVAGFPYTIVYYIDVDEIVILAHAHDRRRPGYWSQRVTG
jgi:hypothetical protein